VATCHAVLQPAPAGRPAVTRRVLTVQVGSASESHEMALDATAGPSFDVPEGETFTLTLVDYAGEMLSQPAVLGPIDPFAFLPPPTPATPEMVVEGVKVLDPPATDTTPAAVEAAAEAQPASAAQPADVTVVANPGEVTVTPAQ
jgi:hypothetical protein